MKRLTIVAISLLWLVGLHAQDAKTLFKTLPDSLLPLLTEVNRADFIDFRESNMKAEVTNRLGGKSEMTELTSDYLRVKLTGRSSWQMKVLPVADTVSVICAVSTVCGEVCDSQVSFYDTQWRQLDAHDFMPARPTVDDFVSQLPDSAGYGARDARRQATALFVRADLSPTSRQLTFTFTTPDYLDKEAAGQLAPYLKGKLTYQWKNKKFTK